MSLLTIISAIGIGLLVLAAMLIYTWWTYPLVDGREQLIQRPGLSAVAFPECNHDLRKSFQPAHLRRPLPALVTAGETTTCWHFTLRDRLKVLFLGKLWCNAFTGSQQLPPLYFSVDKADVIQLAASQDVIN